MLGIRRRGASEKSGAKGSWRYLVPNLLALLALLVQKYEYWRLLARRRRAAPQAHGVTWYSIHLLCSLPGTQFACFTRTQFTCFTARRRSSAPRLRLILLALLRGVLNLLALLRGGDARRQRLVALPGTQFTRFTGTKKVLNYVRAHATRASKGGLLKLLQRFFFFNYYINRNMSK